MVFLQCDFSDEVSAMISWNTFATYRTSLGLFFIVRESNVVFQITWPLERTSTHTADERLGLVMQKFMRVQLALLHEHLTAFVAWVVPLRRMPLGQVQAVDDIRQVTLVTGFLTKTLFHVDFHVVLEGLSQAETFAALIAYERLVAPACMNSFDVRLQIPLLCELGGTFGVVERPLHCVDSHVHVKAGVVREWFAALVADHLLDLLKFFDGKLYFLFLDGNKRRLFLLDNICRQETMNVHIRSWCLKQEIKKCTYSEETAKGRTR